MKNPGIFATSCAAINCDINQHKHATNFFAFPNNESKCKLWVIKCRRLDLFAIPTKIISKYFSLCEKHFDEDCFEGNKLKLTAIPTLFDFPLIRFSIPPLLNKPSNLPDNVADGDLIPGIKLKSINRAVQLPDNKIFICGGPLLCPGSLALCSQSNVMLHSSNVIKPMEKDILFTRYAAIIVGIIELSNAGYGEVKSLELFNVHIPYVIGYWLKAPRVSDHLFGGVIPLNNCEIIKCLPNQKLPKTMSLNNLLIQHENHIDVEKRRLNADPLHFFTQSKAQEKDTNEHKYLAIAPIPPPLPSLTQEVNERKTPSILRKKQKKGSLVYESRPKHLPNLLPKSMNLKTITLPPFMSVTGNESSMNSLPFEDIPILPPIQILPQGQITPQSTSNNSKELQIRMTSSNTGLVPVILSQSQISPPSTSNNSKDSQNFITRSNTVQITPPTISNNSKEHKILMTPPSTSNNFTEHQNLIIGSDAVYDAPPTTSKLGDSEVPQNLIISPNAGLPVITNVFSLQPKLQNSFEERGDQVIANQRNKDQKANKGENELAEQSKMQKSSNLEKDDLNVESNDRLQTTSSTSNKKKDSQSTVSGGNGRSIIIPPGLYSYSPGGMLCPLKVYSNKKSVKLTSHSVITKPNDTSSVPDKSTPGIPSSQHNVPEICLDFIKTLNPKGKFTLKLITHSVGLTNLKPGKRNEADDPSGTLVDLNKLSSSPNEKDDQPNQSDSLIETTHVKCIEQKENSRTPSSNVNPNDEDDVTDNESHSIADPNEAAFCRENDTNDEIKEEVGIIDNNDMEQVRDNTIIIRKTDDDSDAIDAIVLNDAGNAEHMTGDLKGEQNKALEGPESDKPLQVPNNANCNLVTAPSSTSSDKNNVTCSEQQVNLSNKALGGLLYEVNQMPITDQLKNKLKLVLKKREISKPVVASRKFVKIPVSQAETEVTQQMISNFLSELVKMDKMDSTSSKTLNGPERAIICAQDDSSTNVKKVSSICQDKAAKVITNKTLSENITICRPKNTVAKNSSAPNELKSFVFSNQALPTNIRNVIQNIFSSSKTVMVFKENTDKTKPCNDITFMESAERKDDCSLNEEVPNEIVMGPNRSLKLSSVPLDSKDLPEKVKAMMDFYKDKVKKIILMKDCKMKCKKVNDTNSKESNTDIIEDNSQQDSVVCDDDFEPDPVDKADKVVNSNNTSSIPNEKTTSFETLSQEVESVFVSDQHYKTFDDHSYSAPAKITEHCRVLKETKGPDGILKGINKPTSDKTSTTPLSVGVVRTASSAIIPTHIKDIISSVTPKPNKVVVVKGNNLIPEVTDKNGVISLEHPQIKEILDRINSVIDSKDDSVNTNTNNTSIQHNKAISTTGHHSPVVPPLKKKLKGNLVIPRANPASIIRVTGESISTIPHSDKKLAEYVLGLKNEKLKLKREINKLKKKVSRMQGAPPKFDNLMSRLADYMGPEAFSIVSTTAMINKKNVSVGGARYSDELKRIAATIVLTGGWRPYRYLARIFSLPCKQSVIDFINNSMAKLTAEPTVESVHEPESNLNDTAPLNESLSERNDIMDGSRILENNNTEPINVLIPENNDEEEVPQNSKSQKKGKDMGKLSDFYTTLLRNKMRSDEKKKLAVAKKLAENNRKVENKNLNKSIRNTEKKRKNTGTIEKRERPEIASAFHGDKPDKKRIKKTKRTLPPGSDPPSFNLDAGTSRTFPQNDPLFYFSLNDIRRKGFLDPIEMMDMNEETPVRQQQAYEDLVQEIIMEHESESSLSNHTVLEEVVIEDFTTDDIDMSHPWLS